MLSRSASRSKMTEEWADPLLDSSCNSTKSGHDDDGARSVCPHDGSTCTFACCAHCRQDNEGQQRYEPGEALVEEEDPRRSSRRTLRCMYSFLSVHLIRSLASAFQSNLQTESLDCVRTRLQERTRLIFFVCWVYRVCVAHNLILFCSSSLPPAFISYRSVGG